MVDRYKKSGGFVQLLQVLETCGPKKYDQFMGIISTEDPSWAEAIKEKMITFDKILNWKPEAVMEVIAQVNPLAFATALKGLASENLEKFLAGLGHQEKRKIEQQVAEINPTPQEISACMMKVISETRTLLTTGALKAAKIDQNLVIPESFEEKLSSKDKSVGLSVVDADIEAVTAAAASVPASFAVGTAGAQEMEKIQKKLILINRELQTVKQENAVLRDKLEKIRKIA